MANEKRVRVNNVFGQLGSQMAIGDVSITFNAAPNFPTIGTTNHAAIILEPYTTNEEIIYVTAFTSGTTTATILRGQEGTTAVAHSVNAPWVHGATRRDMASGRMAWSPLIVSTAFTTSWSDYSTTNDCTVTCWPADVIEVGVSGAWNAATVTAWADVCSLVSGSYVTSWGIQAAALTGTTNGGPLSLTGSGNYYIAVQGVFTRWASAADIAGAVGTGPGTITFRLRGIAASSTRQFYSSSPTSVGLLYVKNHGPQEA
jgi:hypothetical protein